MCPRPSIIELCDWVADEGLFEQEKEERLCKDNDVVHFVKDAIGDIDGLEEDEKDGEKVAD